MQGSGRVTHHSALRGATKIPQTLDAMATPFQTLFVHNTRRDNRCLLARKAALLFYMHSGSAKHRTQIVIRSSAPGGHAVRIRPAGTKSVYF
jgi:hypothetical protein